MRAALLLVEAGKQQIEMPVDVVVGVVRDVSIRSADIGINDRP